MNIVVLFIILFFIIIIIIRKQNNNIPTKLENPTDHFCILIPARDESKVIEELLKSIQNQSHKIPMKDVYIIVEQESDPTVQICKKYACSVFIRKNLMLQRKGYALHECLQEIYTKNYNAYFIFDADNVLEKDYLKNMIPIYEQGYDLGIGYRNIKNGDHTIPAAATLTFSIINTLANSQKNKDTRNITLSGTGFFINGKWIQKWKGFPFHELTEDYELYLYSITENMTSYYNPQAIFFDEQPTSYKQSCLQRKRWIRGYLDSRKKYRKKLWASIAKKDPNRGSKRMEILGLLPIVILIFIALSPLLYHIINIIKGIESPIIILIDLLIIYGLLWVLTLVILIKEGKKLAIPPHVKWKVLFYHPLFLISYVPCFLAAVLNKNREWKKIEHSEKMQS